MACRINITNVVIWWVEVHTVWRSRIWALIILAAVNMIPSGSSSILSPLASYHIIVNEAGYFTKANYIFSSTDACNNLCFSLFTGWTFSFSFSVISVISFVQLTKCIQFDFFFKSVTKIIKSWQHWMLLGTAKPFKFLTWRS